MRAEPGAAAEFFLRPRFDLPHALARQAQLVADLLERARTIVAEPEPQADHDPLLAVEIAQRRGELVAFGLPDHRFLDRRDAVLREQVAQLAVPGVLALRA